MSDEPRKRRDFSGRRLLVNMLRSLHLVGVVGLGASLLSALSPAEATFYVSLLIASGLGIATLDRWADPAYFSQIYGQGMVFKLLLLSAVAWLGGINTAWFWTVLAGSSLIAHAPRWLRHRRLF